MYVNYLVEWDNRFEDIFKLIGWGNTPLLYSFTAIIYFITPYDLDYICVNEGF